MTISHVYKKVSEAMSLIENLNFYEIESRQVRIIKQQKLNKAYRVLDNFRDELIRESIRNKKKTRRVQMIDKSDLEQMSFLHKEIEDLQERLDKLNKPLKQVIDSVQGSSTGYPYIQHHCIIEGVEYPKHGNLKRKLKKLIKDSKRDLDKRINNLEYELKKIEDSEVRQIIRLRYEDNLNWIQIMFKMDYKSEEKARIKLKRFLEK